MTTVDFGQWFFIHPQLSLSITMLTMAILLKRRLSQVCAAVKLASAGSPGTLKNS